MMFRILTGFFCLSLLSAQSQVLRDVNYNYQYNPIGLFNFSWKVVKEGDAYKASYEVLLNDTTQELKDLTIQFETRESVSEKNGNVVSAAPGYKQGKSIIGSLTFNDSGQKIVVAKISLLENGKNKSYIFYKSLPQNKSIYLSSDNRTLTRPFIGLRQDVSLQGPEAGKSLQLSLYESPFPAGAPAFSTVQAKVSKTLKPDSTFSVPSTTPLTFNKKGLYLAQQDTSSSEGLAFRAESDYPKLATLESLAGPLLYICTKQETAKLKQAGNDKKKFDQVILSITGNAERARIFMRNYFKRVELANLYFSSYKEGWKTDRGMIYIIYGLPEEVYLFEDREVWEYKNDNVKTRFQFVKSPTLFDPENYVLIRDKKYTQQWYSMVDLWRKARF
jgi:GWxTD domain-containing protein